ncbi:hypothetical protein U4W14_13195 [Enterobacter hormaechei]|uniref:hypothetical protein n=1 Tax=Enterobacter hormaechei TaxID=158836 RepID=UPI003088B8CE|nr:hypothetical protein U4W14_13195 [Enterobacter hormaechei]
MAKLTGIYSYPSLIEIAYQTFHRLRFYLLTVNIPKRDKNQDLYNLLNVSKPSPFDTAEKGL